MQGGDRRPPQGHRQHQGRQSVRAGDRGMHVREDRPVRLLRHGRRSSADVRDHGPTSRHPFLRPPLEQFCEKHRGPILRQVGVKRRYRYRFANPPMQPFVIMNGIVGDLLNEDAAILRGSGMRRHTSLSATTTASRQPCWQSLAGRGTVSQADWSGVGGPAPLERRMTRFRVCPELAVSRPGPARFCPRPVVFRRFIRETPYNAAGECLEFL